jgi:putative ABC transport system permease protein
MNSEFFKIATRNLQKRKLRSSLTLLGVFIAITTIFVLTSLSLGLQMAVEKQFEQLGADKIYVMAGGTMESGGVGSNVVLTEEDLKVVEKVQGVKDAGAYVIGNAKIGFANQVRFAMVLGSEPEDMKMFEQGGGFGEIAEGRSLEKGDSKYVNIGSQYKYNKFFSRPVELGDEIEINDVKYKVKGIMEPIGNPQDDRNIYLPLDEFRELFNISERIDTMIVQTEKGEDVKDIAEKIDKKLMRHRDVDEKTRDYSLLTPEELLKTFNSVLGIITIFLVGIGGISLIVGGIGVANTMYTSVLERTKEIGVMKAVGAENDDIRNIFLIESGILGLFGGIIGVISGILTSKFLEYIAVNYIGTNLLQAAIPPYLIIGCLCFAFFVGAVSGTMPAIRASSIKPVNALRYE